MTPRLTRPKWIDDDAAWTEISRELGTSLVAEVDPWLAAAGAAAEAGAIQTKQDDVGGRAERLWHLAELRSWIKSASRSRALSERDAAKLVERLKQTQNLSRAEQHADLVRNFPEIAQSLTDRVLRDLNRKAGRKSAGRKKGNRGAN